MYFIRTTKTASGATAVQIVRYEQRRQIIVRHIGSGHSAAEVASLRNLAHTWIEQQTGQLPLLPMPSPAQGLIPLGKCRYLGFRYNLIYEVLHAVFRLFHLDGMDLLLRDLVLIRVIQPASKLESLELLSHFFGKTYRRADLYQHLPGFVQAKASIENKLGAFARNQFKFDFRVVFYDVTTLYFESFTEDDLRQNGFSKDHKIGQPQILIGLMVTPEGFPVSYQVFEGKVFEGHTMIPILKHFREIHKVDHLTVVADAAMISLGNITELTNHHFSYIVGARTANLTAGQIELLSQRLNQRDGATTRLDTERGLLIGEFSQKRYLKDKREMEKQIARAEEYLAEHRPTRKLRFIKNDQKTEQSLNEALIQKTTKLLGIKGYYTNLFEAENRTIIDQYHNLWRVEQSFRIAKSDLAIRPIYHFKRQAIEAHILICFIALAVCKYLENKTGKSTRQIVKILKSVTDARIKNLLTNEEILLRSEPTTKVQELLEILQY